MKLRYPIGIQTFSKIIEGEYTYIDKTSFIKPLIEDGQFIFLSRPRRFGKSLLVSTLEAYFEGRRELFKGLAIDSMDMDWTPSPVFHLDFTGVDYSLPDGLERRLSNVFGELEKTYGCDSDSTTPGERFHDLIKAVYEKTGRQVVILVDEYDKPLLDIEDYPELFEKNQRILKSVFGNLKGMDRYIRFAFLTGVARFSKVSIFSDLNNLDDISMSDEFADICGWSEHELTATFRSGIEALAEKRKEDFDTTLNALRTYYDGYLFAPEGSRLYNPFSVLKALKHKDLSPYWYETGTPTFLVRRIKRLGTYPPDINGMKCTREQLTAVGMHDSNPAPLMFQTGYLTIAGMDPDTGLYELRFPNREVEIGFYRQLLPMYVPAADDFSSPFDFNKFYADLHEGRPEDFMKRLKSLLKDLPGEDHTESSYRAITYLLAVLCTPRTIAEHHGYKGRSDIEVCTMRYVYLFEFKYNKTVKAAFDQIRERDYVGRFEMDSRKVYLIGANFNERKSRRGLSYKIEEAFPKGGEG